MTSSALVIGLACIPAFLPFSASNAAPDPGLAHSDLARAYRERLGLGPDTDSLAAALDSGYARFELGHFDLRYPLFALADEDQLERLVEIAGALVDLELLWCEWLGADTDEAREARKLAPDVRKWIAGWRKQAARIDGGLEAALDASPDLRAALSPPDKIAAKVERFDALFASGAALGLDGAARQPRERVQLVFAVDREDLVGLASFVGEVDPYNRGAYWHDGLVFWTDFWWNEVQFVGLEYPPVDPSPLAWSAGSAMDAREPTGMLEHVVQRAGFALAGLLFEERLEPALQSGLAQNAVIALYGRNNTRSGGSTKGNSTRARSMFIPGGNPNGGLLPPNDAESRWRRDRGAEHFVAALAQAQRAGKERDADPLSGFELEADGSSQRMVVRAPFLGQGVSGKPMPPEAFHSDYREFFRAYKSAFAHWLESESLRSKKAARATFSELLARTARDPRADFDALVAELYELPLSGPPGAEWSAVDSLERRFLQWLAKQ